ncbi:hypothetical protein RCH18_003234 [Flavobacterium sp. PL11]|nr:hypothetical protein [Flavobacterium sp. PL11]
MVDTVKVPTDAYSFFGLPMFWWFSILIFAGVILAAAHLYRRRKQ